MIVLERKTHEGKFVAFDDSKAWLDSRMDMAETIFKEMVKRNPDDEFQLAIYQRVEK